MKLVRMTNYQALTLRNVIESRASKYTMADLRAVDRALSVIAAATQSYADHAKEAGDEISRLLSDAQDIEDPNLREYEVAMVRRLDVDTARNLREGEGSNVIEVGIDDEPFAVVLKQWRAVDNWSPAGDARAVTIAIDDALNDAKSGTYVDGQFVETEPPPQRPDDKQRPIDLPRQRRRRAR